MFEFVSVTLPLPVPTVQFVVVRWIAGCLTAGCVVVPLYGVELLTYEWDEYDREYEVHVPRQDQPLWLIAFLFVFIAAAWPVAWVEMLKGEV